MAKMMLWVCIGIGGTIGAVIPMLWDKNDVLWSTLLSTIGGIVGIWFWYKYLRFL